MAVFIAMAAIAAATAIVSGVQAEDAQNRANAQAGRQEGIRRATAKMNTILQQEGVTAEAGELSRVLIQNKLKADMAGDAAIAANQVTAAASGTSGKSVNVTANSLAGQAISLNKQVDDQYTRAVNQLNQKFRNMAFGQEASSTQPVYGSDNKNVAFTTGLASFATSFGGAMMGQVGAG